MEAIQNNILSLLASEGYVISPKRRLIVAALCRERQIDDVEAFWIALRKQHAISWSTVFTTFRLLERTGCLIRTFGDKRNQHYILTMGKNTDCI